MPMCDLHVATMPFVGGLQINIFRSVIVALQPFC